MEQNNKQNQRSIIDLTYSDDTSNYITDFIIEESNFEWDSGEENFFYENLDESHLTNNMSIKKLTENMELGEQETKETNSIDIKTKPKIKIRQGLGEETKKMKENRDYRVPYCNCIVYPLLKTLKNEGLKKLGEKYNESFKKEIKERKLPKFGRTEKRNKGIAIWFFEHLIHVIYGWLQIEIQNEMGDSN